MFAHAHNKGMRRAKALLFLPDRGYECTHTHRHAEDAAGRPMSQPGNLQMPCGGGSCCRRLRPMLGLWAEPKG